MKVRGAVALSFAAYGVSSVASILAVPLFLRAFGQSVYGYWLALVDMLAYLSLLNLGVTQTVLSRVNKAYAQQDYASVAGNVRYGVRAYARVCVAAAPIVLAVAYLLPWTRVFHLDESFAADTRRAAMIAGGAFLVELPLSVYRAALQGIEEVGRERIVNVGNTILRLGVAWFCARSHPPLALGIIALSACNITAHLVCMTLVRRKLKAFGSAAEPVASTALPAGFRSASVHYFVLQIAGIILWGTDTPLAGFMLGASNAARVGVAFRAVFMIMMVGTLVGPAVGPTLVAAWNRGDTQSVRALGVRGARDLVAVVVCATLAALVSGSHIFEIWVGSAMFVGDLPWTLYCIFVMIQGVLVIPDTFIQQSGEHSTYARVACLEGILKVGLSLTLMRWIGLAGLPLAILIARTSTTLWYLPSAYAAKIGMKVTTWLWQVLWPSAVAAVAFLIVDVPATLFISSTTIAVFAFATLGGAAFLGVYWWTRRALDNKLSASQPAAEPASPLPAD